MNDVLTPLSAPDSAGSSTLPRGVEHLFRGAGIFYITTLVQLIGRAAVIFIIAQFLGPELLGVYAIGLVTVQALAILAPFGQEIGVVRFLSPAFRGHDQPTMRALIDAVLLTSMSAALVLTIGMTLVFPAYILAATSSPAMASVVALFAPAVLFQVLTQVLAAIGLACDRPLSSAFPERVVGTIVLVLGTFAALLLGWGLPGVIGALVLSGIASAVGTLWMVRDLYPRKVKPLHLRATVRQLFAYSWKLGISNVATYVLFNAAIFVLGYIDATQAGYYAVVSRLTFLGVLFISAFSQIFLPHAAEKLGDPTLESDLQRVTVWMVVLSAPIYILLFAFSMQWMALLGPEFVPAAPALAVMALAQMINMLTGPANALVAMANRPGFKIVNAVFGWGSNLVLVLVLTPYYGVLGAAIAYLVAVVIIDLLEFLELTIALRISPWARNLVRPLLIIFVEGILLTLAARLLNPNLAETIILASIFVAFYAISMWFLGLPRADVEMLKSWRVRWHVVASGARSE